jgi:hypothetical protein
MEAAQIALVSEQKFAPCDFAIGLAQSRFHDRGEEAADNVLTRGSRGRGVFRSGDPGNPISYGNHGNLLSK